MAAKEEERGRDQLPCPAAAEREGEREGLAWYCRPPLASAVRRKKGGQEASMATYPWVKENGRRGGALYGGPPGCVRQRQKERGKGQPVGGPPVACKKLGKEARRGEIGMVPPTPGS